MKPKYDKRTVFIALFVIFVIQFIVFFPSFKLALFGDDWLTFWRHWWILEIGQAGGGASFPSYLSYFLTPYGPMDISMGLLFKVFGFNSLPYYIVSFLLRYILASTIYYVVYRLIKNVWGALIAGVYFSVTVIGLDATNWVFNMTSYLGLSFFMYFVLFYFESFKEFTRQKVFIAYLFLLVAMIIVPIRTHGVIPLILLTESFWYIKNRKEKQALKNGAIRTISFLAVIFIIRNIGTSFANPQESIDRVIVGINMIREMVTVQHIYEVPFYLITHVGNMILPETVWANIEKVLKVSILGRPRPFPLISLTLYVLYLKIVSIFVFNNSDENRKKFIVFAFIGAFWNIVMWILYKTSHVTFSRISLFTPTLLGGYFMIFLFGLVLFNVIDKKRQALAVCVFAWPIAFLLLPWFSNPYSIFEVSHRYMIPSAIGIAIIWGMLFAFVKARNFLIVVFMLTLTIHSFSSYQYLNKLVDQRGVEIANEIWPKIYDQIPHEVTEQNYYIVYLEGDESNGNVIHNNVYYGFPPRLSLLENITDDYAMPFAIMTYNDLVSMVTDGESLLPYGKRAEPVPLERVYSFSIVGKKADEIVINNITEEIRGKLRSEIEEFDLINESI